MGKMNENDDYAMELGVHYLWNLYGIYVLLSDKPPTFGASCWVCS